MTSDLDVEALLAQRDAHFCVDASTATADILEYGGEGRNHRSSRVAYVAYKTLRSLATMESQLIWQHFGDIIAKWSGCTNSHDVRQALLQEHNWVEAFRQKTTESEEKACINKIRNALADVTLLHVPLPALPTLEEYTSEDIGTRVVAMHHRSELHKNTIFILPFLFSIEALIKEGLLSSAIGVGGIWDVVDVTIAKSIMHETRHMVGTLIHGETYCTPPMVQGSFAPLISPSRPDEIQADESSNIPVQGEAGDWFEFTRHGAVLSPALVSATEVGEIGSTTLLLTGCLSSNPSQLRYLFSSVASSLAAQVMDGSFVKILQPFFLLTSTYPVTGYVLYLEDLLEPRQSDQSSPLSPPPISSQTPSHHTTTQMRSGPHLIYPRKLKPIPEGETDIRKIGYHNLRGVLRG
ncbi:hypothetical protein B0H12DRAFT_154203 [Mycena haematopus]|nr:hypothetical protein B0H12DRAFT_154203 [Mycena haematopus]